MTDRNKCMFWGGGDYIIIHKGTRDDPDIDVMKCNQCGLVRLSMFPANPNEMYETGGMHVNAYDVVSDSYHDVEWSRWLEMTAADDDRRYMSLKSLCHGRNVLEFGCGNGGFLRRIRNVAKSVAGVELDVTARRNIRAEGILVTDTIEELFKKKSCKFDVIVSFMVVEHLVEPFYYLKQIRNALSEDGIFVCSTPNADDAMLSYYKISEFADFTYWSEHVYLYNDKNLVKLLQKAGFHDVSVEQVQRYPLSNHLYWLRNGMPGGHMKWLEFNDERLNEEYVRVLREKGICDTICALARK